VKEIAGVEGNLVEDELHESDLVVSWRKSLELQLTH
jgi:hypothetical protein